ncbi:exopolysaccharide biosynthesis protein [Jannaschia ovalis]|uniref:Exopolysaccharide biosynthesis protein n=1 Tax=Jannaschia ovalis TaxID=3038773 RepID=A0ABY8LBR8_9RHOB|nr:exopolysaccharide biosynthesis protein [Jannaschia sp. GRR-S6-38]WGH78776.1 exopolysaccharide biosynthesis protein [Jannaschia sp. GRR-S6-38]
MPQATDILDQLDDLAEQEEQPSIGDVNERLGNRSVGALMAIPASLELTPIGGVPGVPTLLATVIAILAVQVALGRDHMWLPGLLERRSVAWEKLRNAVNRLRPAARWADAHFGRNMTLFVDPPAQRVVAAAILALCLTVPPLELIPFASSLPMGTIVIFGLGILFQDGRLMALGWVAWVGALIGVVTLWPGGG